MSSSTFGIRAGQLIFHIEKSLRSLDELLDFASRENPKRGFLFVSKVLGKHIPVTPSVMRAIYDELATLIASGDSTYVVGMAETATGLGAGVADSLSQQQSENVFYQHTTRHELSQPLWLQLDEAHSHAVDHLLYEPQKEYLSDICTSKRLVLVDDEISTGRTLKLLAERLIPVLPEIEEIVIVSLVSWLSEEAKAPFSNLGLPVRFISLLDGEFEFIPDSSFSTKLPDSVDKDLSTAPSLKNAGRCAIKMPYQGELLAIEGDDPITIVGDGEHLYLPFLTAEKAEKAGRNVLFQSTTRSPILIGGAISTKRAFTIDERPVQHYIYNLAEDKRQVVVMLEDDARVKTHGLAHCFPATSTAPMEFVDVT